MTISFVAPPKDDFSDQLETLRERVRRHCLRLLKNDAEAEDAVQECLAKAWEKRSSYRQESPLENWVMRISTNHCLNLLRKNKGIVVEWEAEREQADPTAVHSLSSSEQQVWLKQILESLQRCMGERDYWIWRQKVGGMTEAEIVRNLPPEWSLSQHGVHSCIQRSIKACLDQEKKANNF